MSETLKFKIQTEIGEIVGKEKISEELGNITQDLFSISDKFKNRFSEEFFTNDVFRDNFDGPKNKNIDNIEWYINQQIGKIEDKKASTIQEYLIDQKTGLTEVGVGKWQRKLEKEGFNIREEYENKINEYIKKQSTAFSQDDKEELQNLVEMSKIYFNELEEGYKNISGATRDYHEEVSKAKDSTKGMFEILQKGGYLGMAGMAINQGIKYIGTQAEIEAREKTSFDLTSPIGMYQERKQFELFQETASRSAGYNIAGTVTGGGLAFLMSGGNPILTAGGMGFGGQTGQQIADIINKESESKVKEELKFILSSFQLGSKYYDRFAAYKVPLTKLEERFNADLSESSGMGYSPEKELEFKTKFSDQSAFYNEDLYKQQLLMSRYYGLDPEMIFSQNTGLRFGGMDLTTKGVKNVEEIAKFQYGDNADNKRIVDILQAIRELTQKQLQLNIDANSKDVFKAVNLPSALFGVDNPYGRINDLGKSTIELFQNLGNAKDPASEALLFQALGKNGLIDFMERKKGGIFHSDNLQKILKTISNYVGDDTNLGYFVMNQMMPNAPTGFIPKMADLVSGKKVDVTTGIYELDEDGKKGRKLSPGEYSVNENGEFVSAAGDMIQVFKEIKEVGLNEFFTLINKQASNTGKSVEEITNMMFDKAKSNITKMESAEEIMGKRQLKIGKMMEDMVLGWQTKMSKIEELWLGTSEKIKIKIEEILEKSTGQIKTKLSDLGINGYENKDELLSDNMPKVFDEMKNRALDLLMIENNLKPEEERLSNKDLDALLSFEGKNLNQYVNYLGKVLSDNLETTDGPLLFGKKLSGEDEEKYWKTDLLNHAKNEIQESAKRVNIFNQEDGNASSILSELTDSLKSIKEIFDFKNKEFKIDSVQVVVQPAPGGSLENIPGSQATVRFNN